MRLIECKINRFGSLENCRCSFSDGLNIILQDNGTGKSTMAGFIRAMLYGLEGNGNRLDTNERKKYAPWKGGNFGGYLILEADGRRLRIERSFGSKAAEDTCEVRDADTNLIISEFENVCIGEKLLGLSRASFINTAFITQEKCETVANSDMTSKMGKLASFDDDMKKYDQAKEYLKKYLDRTSDTRKTGALRALKEEIVSLTQEIRMIPSIENSLSALQEKMEKVEADIQETAAKREELMRRQEELSCLKDIKAKRVTYDHLTAEAKEKSDRLAEVRASLPGSIPDMNRLEKCENEAEGLGALESDREARKLTGEELSELDRLMAKYPADGAECTDGRADGGADDIISVWNARNELVNTLAGEKAHAEGLNRSLEEKRIIKDKLRVAQTRKWTMLLMYGAIMLLCSVAAILMVSVGLGICLAVAAAVIVAVGLVTRKNSNKDCGSLDEEEEVQRVLARIEEISENIRQKEEAVRTWCVAHGVLYDAQNMLSLLYDYRQQIISGKERLNTLLSRKALYDGMTERIRKTSRELEDTLMELGIKGISGTPTGREYARLFRGLENALGDYLSAKSMADAACVKLSQFEKDTPDIEAVRNAKTDEDDEEQTLSEISGCIRELNDRLAEYSDMKLAYQKQRDGLTEEYENLTDKKDELERKARDMEEGIANRRYAQLAAEYLERARNNMTARYSGPIRDAFDRYYRMITGNPADGVYIDTDSRLTYDAEGRQRGTDTLSPGYRDLFGVALRMSFVAAMFEDEKPPVIFDDPFTNLDADKLEGAKKFLSELAKDYQIIYFTCHRSRAL